MDEPVQIRHALAGDLDGLRALYRFLLPVDLAPPAPPIMEQRWHELLHDPKMHCLIADADGTLAASCTLAVIPNLTRAARPYGIIENVVTHGDFRRRGLGTRVLHAALALAWEQGCYKVMLLTSSKDPAVLGFYEQAGFASGVKTGFVVRAPDVGV